jgi:hypothetical protein
VKEEIPLKSISLSKYLDVSREDLENLGVFDATLGIDTPLFVDPKLIVDSDIKEFQGSREKILRYFSQIFRINKQSYISDRLRKKAINMLAVPEPKGTSIGYGNKSDKGTSIPNNVANRILLSANEILSIGIEDPELVELLGLFVEDFGSDSISDLTIHIIYEDFCAYTQRIASELNVPIKEYKIDGIRYRLPTHPFSKEQLIFIPISFLRSLPIATSYDEIAAAAQHNSELRDQLNEILIPAIDEFLKGESGKDAEELKKLKSNLHSLIEVYRAVEVDSYNLRKDEKGYYRITPFVEQESGEIHATKKPRTAAELIDSIRELISQYQRSIEKNGGNQILYRRTDTGSIIPNKPHHEDVAQRLFYMIADLFCRQADIALSGESDAGKGPVDFSLATGYSKKVIVEIKKSDNKNLIDGFKEQVKSYEESENAIYSFYVVILVKEKPEKSKKKVVPKLDQLIAIYKENKKIGKNSPELVIIDGLIYPSPSKLKSK